YFHVTGVQTCALPISPCPASSARRFSARPAGRRSYGRCRGGAIRTHFCITGRSIPRSWMSGFGSISSEWGAARADRPFSAPGAGGRERVVLGELVGHV